MRYVDLIVTRSPMEKIHTQRPVHEIPLLQALHGDGSVEIKPGATVEEIGPRPAQRAEHDRLSSVFGPELVQSVFGHPAAGRLKGFMDADPSELIDGEPEAEAEEPGEYDDLSLNELRAMAEDMGVEFSKRATKRQLIEAIQSAPGAEE